MEEKASAEFWDAFTSAGAPTAHCGCGRVHFVTSQNSGFDYEDEEREQYQTKALALPDVYIANDIDDSLAILCVDGVPVVYGCPCAMSARYERFLLNNEREILIFFRKVRDRKAREAQNLSDGLAEL